MDDTKQLRKYSNLMKNYVLTESAKIHAHFNKKCGNCVEPATEVKEDNGITAKIEVCDTCEKEACACEKEEVHEGDAHRFTTEDLKKAFFSGWSSGHQHASTVGPVAHSDDLDRYWHEFLKLFFK